MRYRDAQQRRRFSTFVGIAFLLAFCYLSFDGRLPSSPAPLSANSNIPPNIWQIFFDNQLLLPRLGESIQSWITMNRDTSYKLLSNEGANEFVRRHYHDKPEILETFLDLQYPIFRADLLRYLLLEAEGGVYADVDTTASKPIWNWIPQHFKPYTRAIVGIEYDQLDEPPGFGYQERLCFAQWTLASAKGHPMMKRVVRGVVQSLRETAKQRGMTLATLQVQDDEVGTVTGPSIFTKSVFESLSEATGTTITYRNLTGTKEPRLFGDILIMPVAAFGTGQPHSGSPDHDTDATLIRHAWKMSWRTDMSN